MTKSLGNYFINLYVMGVSKFFQCDQPTQAFRRSSRRSIHQSCPDKHLLRAVLQMNMKTKNTLIPDRSQPGITMTAPTVRHRDVGDKYATGVPKIKKIRDRENIAVGTWNVRTLRPAGKLKQLTHAMSRWGSVRFAGKTLVRCQQMTDTRCISVEKRTNMRMRLDFLCTRT